MWVQVHCLHRLYIHTHCLPLLKSRPKWDLCVHNPLLVKVMPPAVLYHTSATVAGVYFGKNKNASVFSVMGRAALPLSDDFISKDGCCGCDRSRRKGNRNTDRNEKSGSRLADLPLLGVVILETSSRRLSLPLFENIVQSGVDRCLC